MQKGQDVTLVRLAVGIGILMLFAALALATFYPPRRLEEERNARRRSDVEAIAAAVSRYRGEHGGAVPPGVSRDPKEICRTAFPADRCAAKNGVDLSSLLDSSFPAIPSDPLVPPTGTGTHYTIRATGTGVTVEAWAAEGASGSILVTR
jgi:hypothetical protein